MSLPVLNVTAYRFVDLPDAVALRERLFASAQAASLKGTVLLATEGINLCLAGPTAALRDWLTGLQADTRFSELDLKTSLSATLPFKRLLVKVKREIIRMNQPLDPAAFGPGSGGRCEHAGALARHRRRRRRPPAVDARHAQRLRG